VQYKGQGYTLHFLFNNYNESWPGRVSRVNSDDVVQVGTKSVEGQKRIDRNSDLPKFGRLLKQGIHLVGNNWYTASTWNMKGIFLPKLGNGLRSRSFYLEIATKIPT
jgi:hypothetical protein